MSDDKTRKLLAAIQKLEQAAEKIQGTQGYIADAAKRRALAELIREQLGNENSRTATRALR